MMKKILRFMLIVGLFVATWTSTAACAATVHQLDVTCTNGTMVQGKGEDILPKLSATCVAELGSVVMQLIEVRQTRQKDPSNEVRFAVIHWDSVQAARLREQEQQLFNCRYQTWQQIGAWLIYEDAARTYCGSKFQIGGGCRGLRFSALGFAAYVLLHPQSNTLPYFAIIGGSLLIGGWFFVRRAKRGQLLTFLRPHRVMVIVTTIMAVVVGCFFATSVPDLIAWIVIFYLVACVLGWRFFSKQRKA